jgi:NAD-dependent SIR2 family protein deacetylase
LGTETLSFFDIANPRTFFTDPELAWGFYGHRLNLYRNTQPHDGFYILNKWSQSKKFGSFVFTSNVDGHFQKAGFLTDRIYECHGSIHRLQCTDDCESVWSGDHFEPEIDAHSGRLISEAPICQECGHIARPNILMFDDFNWRNHIARVQYSGYLKWLGEVDNFVVIELGAGTAIPAARAESNRKARQKLIRINPHESELEQSRGVAIAEGALRALEMLDRVLDQQSL